MYIELIAKIILIVLGFWLPAVMLDAVRAEKAETGQKAREAQEAREKFCVGCGLFVVLLVFLL